jgi:hypothetical protein
VPFNPAWEVSDPNLEILEVLKQPFTYLAHGNQSTAFESQDGQYVLKLFRYTRPRFPLIQNIKTWIANKQRKKTKYDLFIKAHKTFSAAYVAYAEARAFTQVVFCHLNLTKNKFPVTQLKAHRTYYLPLDRYRFVLQKKVTPFHETLMNARDKPEEMHSLIDSLIQLLVNRSAQGIRNADPNLGPNFGFLKGQAVEIDFGNYRKPPYNPQKRQEELSNFLYRFEDWFIKFSPEYLPYFQKRANKVLAEEMVVLHEAKSFEKY